MVSRWSIQAAAVSAFVLILAPPLCVSPAARLVTLYDRDSRAGLFIRSDQIRLQLSQPVCWVPLHPLRFIFPRRTAPLLVSWSTDLMQPSQLLLVPLHLFRNGFKVADRVAAVLCWSSARCIEMQPFSNVAVPLLSHSLLLDKEVGCRKPFSHSWFREGTTLRAR